MLQFARAYIKSKPFFHVPLVQVRTWTDTLLGKRRRAFEKRIHLTTSCKDCDDIPKVKDAGQVVRSGDVTYQVMHNGVKVVAGAYHGDLMQKIIEILRGHHEPQEEKAFFEVMKHVRDDALMIELGCYWGYYSLWFRHGKPGRRNFLVEPVPSKIDLAKKNFDLNGYQADFTQGFIGDETGVDAFIECDGRRYPSPLVPFDRYVREKNIEFVDILHADVPGAELKLLMQCEQLLKEGRLGYIFLSTYQDNHDKCLEYLKGHGLKIIAEHSIAEGVSDDGLIVAQTSKVPDVGSVKITKLNSGRLH